MDIPQAPDFVSWFDLIQVLIIPVYFDLKRRIKANKERIQTLELDMRFMKEGKETK